MDIFGIVVVVLVLILVAIWGIGATWANLWGRHRPECKARSESEAE